MTKKPIRSRLIELRNRLMRETRDFDDEIELIDELISEDEYVVVSKKIIESKALFETGEVRYDFERLVRTCRISLSSSMVGLSDIILEEDSQKEVDKMLLNGILRTLKGE